MRKAIKLWGVGQSWLWGFWWLGLLWLGLGSGETLCCWWDIIQCVAVVWPRCWSMSSEYCRYIHICLVIIAFLFSFSFSVLVNSFYPNPQILFCVQFSHSFHLRGSEQIAVLLWAAARLNHSTILKTFPVSESNEYIVNNFHINTFQANSSRNRLCLNFGIPRRTYFIWRYALCGSF